MIKQDDAVAVFDRLASQYDVWYTTPLGAFVDTREKEALFELTRVRPGEQALDVGCGTGNYTLALAQRGVQATGVDLSPAMLAAAISKPKKAKLPVRYIQAAAENLPFPAESFDLVVSVTTLEFVVSPQAAVAEMMRVLRPTGRLVVGILNATSLWALSYRRRKGTIYERTSFFSLAELLALLRPYGTTTWRSCVFIPPWYPGRPGAMAVYLERFGAALFKPLGAFLVARVEKRSNIDLWGGI